MRILGAVSFLAGKFATFDQMLQTKFKKKKIGACVV